MKYEKKRFVPTHGSPAIAALLVITFLPSIIPFLVMLPLILPRTIFSPPCLSSSLTLSLVRFL